MPWRAKAKRGKDAESANMQAYWRDRGRRIAPACSRPGGGRGYGEGNRGRRRAARLGDARDLQEPDAGCLRERLGLRASVREGEGERLAVGLVLLRDGEGERVDLVRAGPDGRVDHGAGRLEVAHLGEYRVDGRVADDRLAARAVPGGGGHP